MNWFKGIFLLLLLALPLKMVGFQATGIDSLFEFYPKTEVLVLGTFHFKDAGLDSYKPEYDINIVSDKRQEELDHLLSKLEVFSPEGIGLEFHPAEESGYLEKYQQYLNGNFTLPANEIYQIGFKLAGRLQLDRVYGIDADARYYSDLSEMTQQEYESLEQKYIDRLTQYTPETKQWYPTYTKWYRYKDSLKTQVPLIDYFRFLNQPEIIERSHGIYLVDTFKLGMGMDHDYFGPDMKTAWYNRNIRILQNIYRMITETGTKRVMVVIGAGHLPILKHAIEASPELEYVDLNTIFN